MRLKRLPTVGKTVLMFYHSQRECLITLSFEVDERGVIHATDTAIRTRRSEVPDAVLEELSDDVALSQVRIEWGMSHEKKAAFGTQLVDTVFQAGIQALSPRNKPKTDYGEQVWNYQFSTDTAQARKPRNELLLDPVFVTFTPHANDQA